MKIFKKERGFTLIELMIVVAIIGILAAVAVPKFADMLEKAREGATKGNVGAIKSAVSIYYGDNQGAWPGDFTGKFENYMDRIPPVKVKGTGAVKLSGTSIAVAISTVGPAATAIRADTIGTGTANDGWKYNNVSGDVWVNSSLEDTGGVEYSMYGYE